jgi:DNA-binding winged helix-turn-helix (wHTH) protein/tetratricopeptide (TPR) repeat protein
MFPEDKYGTSQGPEFRFGDFVFAPSTGDLSQNGTRVRINKQTSDLLAVLVENSGRLVTREEIRDVLWPQRELVDYDKVINNGISRLRYIFKDDPTAPRYIERVPKRGYRFIAEVQTSEPVWVEPATVVTAASHPEPATEEFSLPPQKNLRPWYAVALVAAFFAVVLTVLLVRRIRRPASLPTVETPRAVSVGIAPFEVSGEGAEQLADSFRLDLTDVLSQNPGVRMRAANSLESLRRTADVNGKMGQLGLDDILFGHLTVKGSACHLDLELVKTSDGTHMAALKYDGTIQDLSTMRDRIQEDVLTRLHLSNTSGAIGGTTDPYAYDAYLRGRYEYSLQTSAALQMALKEFDRALELDPKFGKAYAGLARTYLVAGVHNEIPRKEGFQKASEALNKALRIEPQSAEVHALRGLLLYSGDWDMIGAESELRQAINTDPTEPIYHQWIALPLAERGDFKDSLQELQRAHENDPFGVSSYITEVFVAGNAGDNVKLLAAARKVNEMIPGSPLAMDIMGNSLWSSGHGTEAIAEWRAMALQEHDAQRASLEERGAHAFAEGGAIAYARIRLNAIQTHTTGKHPNDFTAAEWYATAHEDQQALAEMKKLFEAHDPAFLDLAMNPVFNRIRNLPEYEEMMQKIAATPSHKRL